MAELAVGTAGHVDHGKTALVRALTGVDCDRLEAERRRGMTISLGFAPWRLASGWEVSVVDVPGHERFVRTMAQGARSIDLGLLCIAVDDGVMPQTREHAAILRLLGVGRVVVVATKADLSDPGRAAAVAGDGRRLAETIGLEVAAAVAVSARTGIGLDRLAAAVADALDRIGPPPDRGLPRLFVDRAFTVPGVGTVVTGTLDGGGVRVGDPALVWPSRARGRILRLERRGRGVEAAGPGGRLAMALRGVPLAAAGRGSVVSPPGVLDPAAALDLLLDVPPSGAGGVRHSARVECLHGTRALAADLWLAGEREVRPGHRAFGQLRLAEPVAALAGDRVLLRAPAPAATLAGAVVLDAHPARHRRWTSAPLDAWAQRAAAIAAGGPDGPAGLVAVEVSAARRGLAAAVAARRAGVAPATARRVLEAAAARGDLLEVGRLWFGPQPWAQVEARARELVAAHQAADPIGPGLARTTLLHRLGLGDGDGAAVLGRLQAAGVLVQHAGVVRAPGAPVAPGLDDPSVRRVRGLIERRGLDAAGADELRAAGGTARVLAFLVRTGAAVELAPGVVVDAAAVAAALEAVLAALSDHPGGLTVSEVRGRLGTSRRVMVPLLERLGREGRTRRVGDRHQLVGAAPVHAAPGPP